MKLKALSLKQGLSASKAYSKFDVINGEHSLKKAAPGAYIEYRVRTRHGGRVFYFNFELAKEMGLIPKDHPETMNQALERKLVHIFGIVIINEYDRIHRVPLKKEDIRPHKYMATRYLQLQHPSRNGLTSGDGRSIWNGEVTHQGTSWDITSCGTGATRLSPATALEKRFFKTGDKRVCYGNGYNSLDDSFSAALMSDVFHKNGIETERTLAIIQYDDESSICVRAGKNLLRPAHFFRPLKQGNIKLLKALVDYYADRETKNGNWPMIRDFKKRYEFMAQEMARLFSQAAARFESDYIFCWMDWDGDNILMNGGIIDYGSVRQFGLYHHEYRYDDVDRFSTKIPEQKSKARYIVQTFAQIRSYLLSGKKGNVLDFRSDPVLKIFDKNFEDCLNINLLRKTGFEKNQIDYLLQYHLRAVTNFRKHFSYFEKSKSKRGIVNVPDGVSCDAIFSMHDALRELPRKFSQKSEPLDPSEFIVLIKSSYAKKRDLELSPYRLKEIQLFQESYLDLQKTVAKRFNNGHLGKTLLEVMMRASLRNPRDRITGDGVLCITEEVLKQKKKLSVRAVHQIIRGIVHTQLTEKAKALKVTLPFARKRTTQNRAILREYRESI